MDQECHLVRPARHIPVQALLRVGPSPRRGTASHLDARSILIIVVVMLRKTLLLIAFFLAGFSSLVYEVIWSRQLSVVFGSTVYAVSVVLAAFMAGLGLGSILFGRVADRAHNPLRRYAIVQTATGISAVLVTLLIPGLNSIYPSLLSYHYPPFILISFMSFVLSFILILIPAALIGASFPLMTRAYIRQHEEIGSGLGVLYAVNTLGSMSGALVAGFLLIGALGLTKASAAAALVNLLVGSSAFLLSMRQPAKPLLGPPQVSPASLSKPMSRFLVLAIAISGFAALGYEVIWTRILSIFLQNTVYSFTTILASFLAGIAFGSLLYSKMLAHRSNPVFLFAFFELLLGLYVLTLHLSLPQLPGIAAAVVGNLEVGWTQAMLIQFGLVFIIFLPTTIALGIIFPLVARAVTQEVWHTGTRIGLVYGLNTFGAILGALSAGFILIPLIGTQAGNKVLAWINIMIGTGTFLLLPRGIRRRLLYPAAMIVGAGLVLTIIAGPAVLPPSIKSDLGKRFRVLYYRETASGTVSVAEERGTGIRSCYVNNSAVCGTTYDALKVVRMLGSLPLLLHQNPQKVLVIGFGIGITTATAVQFDVRQIDCVEICPAVAEAAAYFAAYNQNVLRNPKVNLIKGDGRNYLLLTKEKYDVISCDPTHPLLGSGALYTKEYFALCRQRLNPGGVVCQYLPLHKLSLADFEAILRAFHEIFPNCSVWLGISHGVLAGQVDDTFLDFTALAGHLARPRVKRVLEPVNLATPYDFLGSFIMDSKSVAKFVAGAKVNSDDRPSVEFSGSRSLGKETWTENMIALFNFRRDPSAITCGATPEQIALIQTYQLAKFYMYQGLIQQNRGLMRSAVENFYGGLRINPSDKELALMLERAGE